MRCRVVPGFGLIATLLGLGQGDINRPAFEAASVKLTAAKDAKLSIDMPPGGGFRANNADLTSLIAFGYRVRAAQISGVPKSLRSTGFDIVAKADNDHPSIEQLRLMVQSLLADRFKLTLHRLRKEGPVYALVLAKGGPRLDASVKDETSISSGRLFHVVYQKVSMPLLAENLSQRLSRTVLDRTGLEGDFDFKLEWVERTIYLPLRPASGLDAPEATGPTGPSLFTAMQEQLGLKLEAAKGPVDMLVIDHVEMPSQN
jgi:uncharacterized protein (TIGR03435 family)